MPIVKTAIARTPRTLFGMFILFWKFRFWLMLILILAPTVMDSIKVAVETDNPSYPFAQLGLRIFSADNDIQKTINILDEDPKILIGLDKPSEGIWMTTVYYWKLWWNVIFRILGDIYLIFLPLYVIYRLLRFRNISEVNRNIYLALGLFLLYLFVANTVVFTHGIIKGNTIVTLPENLDTFKEYWILFKYLLPFHGLVSLVQYLFQMGINS